MKINLNDPQDFTIENMKNLIASGDDSVHTQVRVTKDGYLFLEDDIGGENRMDILFVLEPFLAGNDYVGFDASQDEVWIKQLFNAIKDNWPIPKARYIDYF